MSVKNHRFSVKAGLAFLLYLFIPLCALLMVLRSYPEVPSDLMYRRICWVIPTALLIIILAQYSSRYKRGETKRYLLNLVFTAMTMLWMFGLLGGGFVMTTQWNNYEFSLHMDKYVLLIISVAVLNAIYYTLEWMVYRKDQEFLPAQKKTSPISKQ
jgi:hypothetical protein